MKRRSFIGSLFAMISAAFVWPRIPKPAAPDPELAILTPRTIFTCKGEGFELGDMVYWDMDGKCLKVCSPKIPEGYQRVMGIVVDSGSIDNNTKIILKGIG